jgi:hypothetical protein
MKPVLKFLPGEVAVQGKVVYRQNDLTLEYQTEISPSVLLEKYSLLAHLDRQFNVNQATDILLIADTLTLTFSAPAYHLSGFDAYTNSQLWLTSGESEVPQVSEQGLLLIDAASVEGDRYSLNIEPKYEIAPTRQWVRVIFSESYMNSYYEIASNMIVGLREAIITDIYLLNVEF